ncbi:MAG: nucleotidyltransferase family protein [Ancrocorticia sp.]|uniref:nucleotidyltransferase family protein n=1 Tax=Ancrocorticia sp. TaxID=2593684 RepID=UPI003F8EDC1D
MTTGPTLDLEAIRRACQQFDVERLRVFGSAVSNRFDPATSDVDFLVDFNPDNDNLFADFFDLKEELERIVGRSVDLVDASAVRNPYFKASAFGSAQDLYAA